jgi:hypothetical protein
MHVWEQVCSIGVFIIGSIATALVVVFVANVHLVFKCARLQKALDCQKKGGDLHAR